ncbi:MAG: SGNH/GDSL hydrolase family protein [Lachnospiraceae bacterium]|nr:SGNH/GDSL hydrolase family protein [Lachnospiraceae bacterium]
MQTIELLEKINELIKSGTVLPAELWDETAACIRSELEWREAVYDRQEAQELAERIGRLCSQAAALDGREKRTELLALAAELKGMAGSMPKLDSLLPKIERDFFCRAAYRHFHDDTVAVIGDSHVNFFSGNELITYEPIGNGVNICPDRGMLPFTALHLGPCTAYNCLKADSKTLFLKKLEWLKQSFLKPGAKILLSLGEIDIRVHVKKQAERGGRDMSAVMDDILANYRELIEQLENDGYRVYCWGPVASQRDDARLAPDYPRYGSETERNRATEYFNLKLAEICAGCGAGFASIFDEMMTEDYRTKNGFLSIDGVHLSQAAMPAAKEVLEAAGLL